VVYRRPTCDCVKKVYAKRKQLTDVLLTCGTTGLCFKEKRSQAYHYINDMPNNNCSARGAPYEILTK
jgi:hypothetical protein